MAFDITWGSTSARGLAASGFDEVIPIYESQAAAVGEFRKGETRSLR